MSRIFVKSKDGWKTISLDADRFPLPARDPVEWSAPRSGWDDADAAALLLRVRQGIDGSESSSALVADRRVRALVNGEPIATGMALLRDRDELRMGGAEPVYFSTERLASVEACERDDAPRCPRCAQEIARGEMSVRCPGCGVLHHQMPERECWTYLEKCALCEQATDLAAGLRWSPEDL